MNKLLRNHLFLFIGFILSSCATKQVVVYCEPQNANIYINEHLVGQGIVYYQIPRNQKYIMVSCGEGDIIYTSRKFYINKRKSEINIYLEEYKKYSSSPNTISTH